MFRIAALNESESSDYSQGDQYVKESTKEAKEAEAYSLYNKALGLLRHGDNEQAEEVFRDLIDHDFLQEAWYLLEEKGSEAIHPGLQLLYSIQKNLAAMATQRQDYTAALESYMEAVKIDNSEVTVWYKVGVTSLRLEDYQLAKLAFEQGLECNPKHWPCLDNIITLMFALNNYMECLYYIGKAFEMEVHFDKGYALRDKIFKDQPCLKKDTEEFFQSCSPEVFEIQIDPEEAKEFVDAALHIRARKQVLSRPPEPERLNFPPRLKAYSWQCVGEVLMDLYDKVAASDPPILMGLKVNVPDYADVPAGSEETEKDKMETDTQDNKEEKLNEETNKNTDSKDMETENHNTESKEDENNAMESENETNVIDKSKDPIDEIKKTEKTIESKDSPGDKDNFNTDDPENEVDMETDSDCLQNKETVTSEQTKDSNETLKTELRDTNIASINHPPLTSETSNSNQVDNKKGSKIHTTIMESDKTQDSDIIEIDLSDEEDEGSQILSTDKDIDAKIDNAKDKSSIDNKENKDIVLIDESDSVQEAFNTVQTLLDSLSPAKPNSNQNANSNSPPCNKPIEIKAELFKDKPKSEPVDLSESIKEEPIMVKNEDKMDDTPSLIKTKSLGFSVVDLISPQSKEEPVAFFLENKDTVVTDSVPVESETKAAEDSYLHSPTPELSTATVSVASSVISSSPSANVSSVSRSSPVTSSISLPVTQSSTSVIPSAPVIHVSQFISSKAISTHSSPTDLNFSTSPSLTVNTSSINVTSSGTSQETSSIAAGSQSNQNLVKPITSQSQTGSENSYTNVLDLTDSSNLKSQTSSPQTNSTTSLTQRKDHEYSKNYVDMPPLSRSDSGGFTPVSMVAGSFFQAHIPVTQSLHPNFDPSGLESSPRSGVAMEMDDRSPGGRKGQKRRKISLATEEIMMYGKRRSARVRNTGKKQEDKNVNFSELLQAFLPSSLKNVQEDDIVAMETGKEDSNNAESVKSNESTKSANEPMDVGMETWNEQQEVMSYLHTCLNNFGLIHMMELFLKTLAKHYRVKWCEELPIVYIEVFSRVRKHLYMPNVFDTADSEKLFRNKAQICLIWLELQLDQWLVRRSKAGSVSGMSPTKGSSQLLPVEDVPPLFDDDTWFLTVLCGQSDRLGDIWIDACIRVYWMKARYCVLRGNIEEAIFSYERTKEYLEYGQEEKDVCHVSIPNCVLDNAINLEIVISQQEMLEKNHNVEETQRLYETREYERVVEILLQTFTQLKHNTKMVKICEPTERQSQLLLLQEALYKTGDYNKCILWGEESFNETYQERNTCINLEEKARWTKTMLSICNSMKIVLEKHEERVSIVKCLTSAKLVRFSQNCIQLIDANMSLHESVTEMVVDSVVTWILLYYIIKHEEDKIESIRLKDSGSSDELDEAMSSSHMLLNIAHDYLGSRSWCTRSEGQVLVFYMSMLQRKLEGESKFLEEYQQAFEQCVYCLYGHPNKKGKAKHLQDHNVSNVALQWPQAILVFNYFKPKVAPEFDGYKSETISTELEFLLKRIIPLVPEESKSTGVSVEEIQSYIEGVSSSAPEIQEGKQVNIPVVDEIYYLLADYYLKNKETMKAIKFYIHDLCMNPRRLDSWAGMALARMSQLEVKLTSAELKMDAPVYKRSIAALRCFKRAVEIDDSNSKLWIEYGTLAYQLHSHASRQIKWKKWFVMEADFVEIAVESKREMLQTALNCFKMAADCEQEWNEDEWLHLYMQGKCHEKMRKSITEVVPQYFKALTHLHENGAKYPKKIVYAYTTPQLSVEALEMYYRMHVIMLKTLLKCDPHSTDIDYQAYLTYIIDAAKTPFVRRGEKGNESKQSESSADESSCTEISPPDKDKPKKSSSDHTYFRQKSQPGGATDPVSGDDKSTNQTAADNSLPPKSVGIVTTLELHSEEQTTKDTNVTLTTTECPGLLTPESGVKGEVIEKIPSETKNETTPAAKVTPKSSFSISSILGESNANVGDETKSENKQLEIGSKVVAETSEKVVRSVLSRIEDLIEAEMENIDKEDKMIEAKVKETAESAENDPMDTDESETKPDDKKGNVNGDAQNKIEENADQKKIDLENIPKGQEKIGTELKEKGQILYTTIVKVDKDTATALLVHTLLKKSAVELHKYVIEKCRQALELCLSRFPTHYKSHYRLAYLYVHSPYHKNLTKAHHILLGVPKWQHVDYMPCQGLFGERKQTKFFQGIWKIPIDEIDRSGSFPSHLNRCIQLALDLLKEESDSQTLHQVHLQLNRQPEPGKKYLRDAEKKYYALMSHRYTLDAVETQIEEMKATTDVDVRIKFLLNVYKIWEHGVHKLNKHVERSNKLLAEAYRVVVRKLETLPHKMLLDQAVRFCKQRLTQKSSTKNDKSQDSSRSQTGSQIMTSPVFNLTAQVAAKTVTSEPQSTERPRLSLEDLMNSQTDYSLSKSHITLLKPMNQSTTDEAKINNQSNLSSGFSATQNKANEKEMINDDDVIVLSDSSNSSSPIKMISPRVEPKQMAPPTVSSAPTVKIKMGLLQAVKKLKPAAEGTDEEFKKPLFGDFKPSASSGDESEAPIPSGSEMEGNNSESSESSSSTSSDDESSSSESDDDENEAADDDENEADDEKEKKDEPIEVDDDDDDEKDSSADDDNESDDDDEDNGDDDEVDGDESSDDEDEKSQTESKNNTSKERKGFQIVTAASTDDDFEESSDNEEEIDLISSDDDDEKGDDKDADYKASDDDVIVLSDEEYVEYAPKGRAIVPSPPHKKSDEGTEVLVNTIPAIDPLMSSFIGSTHGVVPIGAPVPVGSIVSNIGALQGNVSVMEIDSD